jgi:hypothetical protein
MAFHVKQIGFASYVVPSEANQFFLASDCTTFCVKQIGFALYFMRSDKKHNLPY